MFEKAGTAGLASAGEEARASWRNGLVSITPRAGRTCKQNQQCHGPSRSAHLVVTESVTRSSGQRNMDSVWGRQVFRTVSAALHEGAFSPGL